MGVGVQREVCGVVAQHGGHRFVEDGRTIRGMVKEGHSYRKNGPLLIPQNREGPQPINPTAAGLTVDRLHTLRKGVCVILVAAFDLTFSLRPLPLCLEVTKELANDLVSPPQQRLSGKRRMSNRSEERRQHTAAEIRFDRSSLREKRAKGWIASFRPSLIAPYKRWIASFRPSLIAPYKRCDIAAAAPRSSCDIPAPRTDIWTDRRPACRP